MAYTSMSGACCAPCASGRACTAASLAVGNVFTDAAAKAEAVFTKKPPTPLVPAVATTASSSHLGLIAVVGAAALGVVLLARLRRRR